jgi:hypothetical protein
MWAVTGWALVLWAKLTVALALVVAVLGWNLGIGSGGFVLAATAAVLAELYLTGQLVKEWAHEARACWWWAP